MSQQLIPISSAFGNAYRLFRISSQQTNLTLDDFLDEIKDTYNSLLEMLVDENNSYKVHFELSLNIIRPITMDEAELFIRVYAIDYRSATMEYLSAELDRKIEDKIQPGYSINNFNYLEVTVSRYNVM